MYISSTSSHDLWAHVLDGTPLSQPAIHHLLKEAFSVLQVLPVMNKAVLSFTCVGFFLKRFHLQWWKGEKERDLFLCWFIPNVMLSSSPNLSFVGTSSKWQRWRKVEQGKSQEKELHLSLPYWWEGPKQLRHLRRKLDWKQRAIKSWC